MSLIEPRLAAIRVYIDHGVMLILVVVRYLALKYLNTNWRHKMLLS